MSELNQLPKGLDRKTFDEFKSTKRVHKAINDTFDFKIELNHLLKKYPKVDKRAISIVEDKIQEEFILSSKEAVRNKIAHAEKNNSFTSHDEFWSEIDNKIK